MHAHADTPAHAGARLIGGLLMLVVLGAQLGWAEGTRAITPHRGVSASEQASVRALGERVARVLRVLMERPAAASPERGPAPAPAARRVTGVVAPEGPFVAPAVCLWHTDLPPPAC